MTTSDYSTAVVRHRIAIDARVEKIQQLSPLMRRLTFSSADFVGQEAISCADTYMKLVVADPSDPEQKVLRSYTVRSHDSAAGLVEVDFALHGKGGFAAQWAQQVQVGESAVFKGIGGGYNPSAQAPWHLFIGDDSALPAIAAAVDQLEPDARSVIILEGATREQLLGDSYDLRVGDSADLFIATGVDEVLGYVEDSFAAFEGTPHVFLHGEACMVRDVRRVLRAQYNQSLKTMSVSGYWRDGASDEQWREMKREFAQAQELEEEKALAAVAG